MSQHKYWRLQRLLNIDTSLYWIIDSIIGFTLNISPMFNNIYIIDITRCFVFIHVLGQDIFYEAMKLISSLGVSNMKGQFPNFEQLLWIKINDKGITLKVVWAFSTPRHGNWLSLIITKFLMFHKCLTTNALCILGIELGNKFWASLWVFLVLHYGVTYIFCSTR